MFTIDEVKLLIESIRLRRFDTYYFYLCQLVYAVLKDDSYDWLFSHISSKSLSNEEKYNYSYVLHKMPGYSDGAPSSFIRKIPDILLDDSLEQYQKSFIYNGIVTNKPIYRDEETFTQLLNLCDWMLENGKKNGIANICLSSPKQQRQLLMNRQRIINLFESQHIFIPESLDRTVLGGEMLASKRFCGFGFNSGNIYLLHRAIMNIWGQQGPWDIDTFPNIIRHDMCDFFFTNRLIKMSFAIEWERIDDVTYHAIKMGILPEEPFEECDWCYS
jgi:hypothetical protein